LTLALACISDNHVVQVSDRRLTWITGPHAGKVADDGRNKALVVCNRFVLAYTGLAQIANQKTDEWALNVAARVNPASAQGISETIAKEATEEFRKLKIKKTSRRHAFLISGWAKFNRADAPFSSFVSSISNALDNNWQWLPEPEDIFRIRTVALGPRSFLLAGVGRPLGAVVRNRLIRRIRAYAGRDRGPEAYIQLLATAIRETAVSDRYIGKDLIAVSLPRAALDKELGLFVPLAFPMPSDKPFALYLPDKAEAISYTPNYTCGGISMKGGWVRPG